MKLIRRIMQDRSSAGAVAVLAVLLFLLQGLANGVAHGSMAATVLAADEIICSAHMPGSDAGKQSPTEKLANSCCGTLCRLASASFTALLASPGEIAGRVVPHVHVTLWRWSESKISTPPTREQQPRGPPSPSHA